MTVYLTPPTVALPTLNTSPGTNRGLPISMMAAVALVVAADINGIDDSSWGKSGPPQKASSMIWPPYFDKPVSHLVSMILRLVAAKQDPLSHGYHIPGSIRA